MGVWNQSLEQGACMDFEMILDEYGEFTAGRCCTVLQG